VKKLLCLALLFATSALADVRVMKDVSYLGEDRTEKMDIYLPDSKTGMPTGAVLLIHGGGWSGGDKADKRGISISTDLSGQGYAVFAINYLLMSKAPTPSETRGVFPQNVYDCKSGLRFIRANAKKFNIDPNRIAVMGESAGGHLVLLLGATTKNAELNKGGLYVHESDAVNAVVDMYGIYDLETSTTGGVHAFTKGADEAASAANLKMASPSTYMDKSMPPTLILHGTADTTVPIAQSEELEKKLKELGVPYEFVKVPQGHHSFDLHPQQMDLRPAVFDFLKKYIGSPKF
jgi:acetyl esterase/lipase